MPPQPRELTDDYRLERILSSSRGASILGATALATSQAVVVKLINVPAAVSPARAAAAAARFTATAAALAALRHPNLPRVLDSGVTPDGGAFLVMEKLDGVGFDAHTLAAGGAPEQVLPLLAQALAGLEELARHGLAHLNVAPENLFLAAAGGAASPTVKLLGLGTPIFYLGEAAGEGESARFRAPELALPAAAAAAFADWHADCYSLALTACNALGATVAFGEAAGPIVQMPLALSFELDNDEALRRILERCLRRVPALRPTHAEIRDAFGLALGSPLAPPAAGAAADSPPAVPWIAAAVPLGAPLAAASAPQPAAPRPAFTSAAGTAPTEGWRTALSSQMPPAETPSWRSSRPVDPPRAEEPPAPMPAEPVSASPADSRGSDSFLDLFAVPDALPDLLDGQETDLGGAAGEGGAGALSTSEMAAALGLDRSGGHGGAADSPFGSSLWEASAASPQPGAASPPTGSRTPFDSSPFDSSPFGAAPFDSVPLGAAPLEAAAPAGIAASGERSRPGGGFAQRVEPTVPARSGAVQPPAAKPPLPPTPPVAATTAMPATAAMPATIAPQGGELLSAVDDLLGSLPPPAPVQPAAAAPRTGKSAASAAVPAGGPGRGAAVAAADRRPGAPLAFLPGLPRPLLLGAACVLALLIAAGAFLLFRHRGADAGSPVAAVGADAATAPPEKPGRSAAAKFFDARSYQILGRESDGRVRQALRELTFGEQGELGEDGCRELRSIEQTLALAALETAPQDLANGLRNGDLGLLESVAGVAADQDVPANQKVELERARSMVKLYDEAQAAAARGDQAEVLERFRTLEGLSRTLHDPQSLREKAAAALESEAAALAQDGKYDQAIGRLEPLRRTWPERGGIKDLLKTYESAAANETAQLALLDEVPNILRRRKPSEGLDALRPVKPTPHLAARVQDAIQQLEAQLAQLDAQPPQVALRDDFPLDYSRGQVVTLSFRVTDDYQVKSVKLFARPEGGSMREMPLQRVGLSYTIEMPPAFHQNGTVDFYVMATDLSGHEGFLGSREKPLQLKRRQGFERLLH
jgi:hypothetical protein